MHTAQGATWKEGLPFFVLIGVTVFVIPFLFSSALIDPVLLPRFLVWSILVFVLTLLISIRSLKRPACMDVTIVRRTIFLTITGYLFFSALSLINAINITEGVFELMKLFLSVAFLYVATLAINGREDGIVILVKSVVVSGMLLSLIGICQYYCVAFGSIPGNYAVYATMANKNLFASFLFLVFSFVLYGALKFSGFWRLVSLASMTVILISIAITEARSVWLAMIISTIIISLIIVIFYRKSGILDGTRSFHIERSTHCFIVISLVVLIAIVSHLSYTKRVSQSILSTHQTAIEQFAPFTTSILSLSTLKERIALWRKSIRMIKDNLLFGVGPGQWKIVLPHYGRIERMWESEGGLNEVYFQRPHNDYLWVLSEVGPFGFFFYLSIFATSIFYIISILHDSKDPDKKLFSILMLFGIIGYMVISFFSFPKERIAHNVYLILIMASVLSIYHKSFPMKERVSHPRVLLLHILLMALLLICIIFGWGRLRSEFHTKSALDAQKDKNWNLVISEINQADSFFYNMDPMSTPLPWYKGVANFSLGNIEGAFDDFKRAYEIHPNHIHVLNNLGTCYAVLGDYKRAAECYQKVLAISPGFDETIINLRVVRAPDDSDPTSPDFLPNREHAT
jgi:O-antigen ligase